MNESELIDKVKNKDEEAFGIFLDKYFRIFYHVAKQILFDVSTHDDIMDCLSESYIYIWYHIDNYDPNKYSFRNWCCLIVVSRAKNHLESLRRHRNKLLRFQGQCTNQNNYAPSAEEIYISNTSIEMIIEKLNVLPPQSREVFKLRYASGLKPRQIAKELNLTVKQVDNYLSHAKKKLRKEGFVHETE